MVVVTGQVVTVSYVTTVVVWAGGGAAEVGFTPVGTPGVGGWAHWVQMVDVEVSVMVETVLDTSVVTEAPEVMVLVTGQVVTVS